jgi:hypothetical protein
MLNTCCINFNAPNSASFNNRRFHKQNLAARIPGIQENLNVRRGASDSDKFFKISQPLLHCLQLVGIVRHTHQRYVVSAKKCLGDCPSHAPVGTEEVKDTANAGTPYIVSLETFDIASRPLPGRKG